MSFSGRAVSSRPLRAACALVAGVNGLLYSLYALASIKELVTTTLLTLLAWAVIESLDRLRPRALAPLLIAVAAPFEAIGITAVPWIGVPIAAFVIAAVWRLRPALREIARTRSISSIARPTMPLGRLGPLITVVALGLVAVLYPIISKASTFFIVSTDVLGASSTNVGAGTLGYLVAPLNRLEMFGIWPDYDFRFPLEAHIGLTHVLIGIEIGSGVLGTLWLLRRRGWGPLVLLAGSGIGALYLLHRSTPYAASKVMLIASVGLVLAGTTGAAALYGTGAGIVRRFLGWSLIAVLAAGVLWTDGLVYRYSSVAPAARLHELAGINVRYSHQGSALYPYGADSLTNTMLSSLDPYTADTPGVVPRSGLAVDPFTMYQLRWDTDNISQPWLRRFTFIVQDGSPAFSRPPGDFSLIEQGPYYNVWRRTRSVKVIKHIGFGTYPRSSAIPSCKVITSAARTASKDHARLAYVRGSNTSTMIPARQKAIPFGWVPITGDPDELIPRGGPGSITGSITAKTSGTYQIWLDGSYGQKFTVSVDGHEVGDISNQLGPAMQATHIATIHLSAGHHRVTIARGAANSLLPDTDDANPNNRSVGPVMFVQNKPDYTVSTIAPSRARSLCGTSLDWLEVIR